MVSIYGPESDPDEAEDALDEMEHKGAGMMAIAIHGEDAVLATEYDLEQTEAILMQLAQIVRLSRAN